MAPGSTVMESQPSPENPQGPGVCSFSISRKAQVGVQQRWKAAKLRYSEKALDTHLHGQVKDFCKAQLHFFGVGFALWWGPFFLCSLCLFLRGRIWGGQGRLWEGRAALRPWRGNTPAPFQADISWEISNNR